MSTTIILNKSACGARQGLGLKTYLSVVSFLAGRKKSLGANAAYRLSGQQGLTLHFGDMVVYVLVTVRFFIETSGV